MIERRAVFVLHAGRIGTDQDDLAGEIGRIDLSVNEVDDGDVVVVAAAFCGKGDVKEAVIAEKMLNVLSKVASWPDDKPVPGLDPRECGNYKEHDLATAKVLAKNWVDGIKTKGFDPFVKNN